MIEIIPAIKRVSIRETVDGIYAMDSCDFVSGYPIANCFIVVVDSSFVVEVDSYREAAKFCELWVEFWTK